MNKNTIRRYSAISKRMGDEFGIKEEKYRPTMESSYWRNKFKKKRKTGPSQYSSDKEENKVELSKYKLKLRSLINKMKASRNKK